jgi:hypothetical protein
MSQQFSVRDALAAGATKAELRRLPIPFRGARDVSAEVDSRDRYELRHQQLLKLCLGYLPVAPAAFAFSHATAAAIYGMPLPRRLELGPLHVSVPAGAQPPRRAGVVGHRGVQEIRVVGELPVVAPEIAWLQLAPALTVDEMVVAGDFLLRKKRRLSSSDSLGAAVERAVRMRGVSVARTALIDVREGTESRPESQLRLILVRAGLPEPVVGHTVYHQGAFVGTPDLAYIEHRIAIEYEGEHHRLNVQTYEEDIYRREMFERAGWRVYLVTGKRLRNPAGVVAQVTELLQTS